MNTLRLFTDKPPHWSEPTTGQYEFGRAVEAIARLYAHCEKTGNTELGRRAEAAFNALWGKQTSLEFEPDPFPENTLSGLG